MIFSWGHNRRFNAASNYLRREFGTRVQKITIDAGFTCPNRDGMKSTGGCAFCNNDAFNPSYCTSDKPVSQQIREGLEFHRKRYKSAAYYLAYFQAFSNTYASVSKLKKLYDEALNEKNVIGLIIGTRPDCMNSSIYDLLQEYNQNYYVVLEFGVESVYNQSLEYINRGHTFEDSVIAIRESVNRGLKTGAHLMFGIPGETREMMLDSVDIISELPLHTIKFHQLQIVKKTRFADEYLMNPDHFNLFTIAEYVEFITEYLSRFSDHIIIERLAGETQPWQNIGVKWNLRYDQVLQLIEKKLEEKDIWQGKYFQKKKNQGK